eukprot:jgi/Psemu1/25369/gm1.25369_g
MSTQSPSTQDHGTPKTCHATILTQSPARRKNYENRETVDDVMELFVAPGDMSPDTAAKFASVVAQEEAQTANYEGISPLRKRMSLQNQMMRSLQDMTAKTYIKCHAHLFVRKKRNLMAQLHHLRNAKKNVYKSEGYFMHTTTVFTLMSLLWNIVACKKLHWEVCASADGTDNTICNDYKLLSFGTMNVDDHRVKQFRPFFYVLGPGEQEEIMAIGFLAFLTYSNLIFGTTKIHFKGGVVSDHSNLFTNTFSIAFPLSLCIQCFSHIIQKFTTNQKGNDNYSHLTSADFLKNVAVEDVRNLHRCSSFPMFQTNVEMVKEKWVKANQKKLLKTFFKSYIIDDTFNKWFL